MLQAASDPYASRTIRIGPGQLPIACDEHTALPAPDEHAFGTDYRPWRTVILADGSAAATYLALDAVTQWTDAPARVAAGSDDAGIASAGDAGLFRRRRNRHLDCRVIGGEIFSVLVFERRATNHIISFLRAPERQSLTA